MLSRPSRKLVRRARNQAAKKLFDAGEIRKLVEKAPQPMKAMILLGINAGLGNADCGRLPLAAIDLEKNWLVYPRPKTEIQRRCPLWPETVQAVKEAIAERPTEKDKADAGLAF